MSALPATPLPIPGATPGPLFIVLNPGSGSGAADSTEQAIADVLQQAGREHRFIRVERGAQIPAAVRQAAQLARRDAGCLVAVGGDGTINAAARAALDAGCPLGVVPQGTFNYFARALSIPEDAAGAARVLLDGRLAEVPAGCANGELFLVNASLGLYPKLIEDREAFAGQLGRHRIIAILSSLLTLIRLRRQLSVERGDADAQMLTPTMFIGINRLQLERLGLPEELLAELEHPRLIAMTVKPISSWQMLGLVLRGALGRLGDAEQINRFAFEKLGVSPRGKRSVRLVIDGEIIRLRTPVRFSIHPQRLQVLVPAADATAE